MKRIDEICLVSRMSAALDRFSDAWLGRSAMRLCAYPPEARNGLTDSELARLDKAALLAQRARRQAMQQKAAAA